MGELLGLPEFLEQDRVDIPPAVELFRDGGPGGFYEDDRDEQLQRSWSTPLDLAAERLLARTPQPSGKLPSVSPEEFERRFGRDTPGLPSEFRDALTEMGVSQFPTMGSVGTITQRDLLGIQDSTAPDILRFSKEAAGEDTEFQRFLLDRFADPDFGTEFTEFARERQQKREDAAFAQYGSVFGSEGEITPAPAKEAFTTRELENLSSAQKEWYTAQSAQRTPFADLPIGVKQASFAGKIRAEPISAVDYARTRESEYRELFEDTPGFLEQKKRETQRPLGRVGRTIFTGGVR
jgi:hypothetical protein